MSPTSACLNAIEGHVFGVPVGNRVGMAVYVADVSEPGRGVNADIRELAMSNLSRAYQQAVDSKVTYLRSQRQSGSSGDVARLPGTV